MIDIARKVAIKLGIEHHAIDVRDAFYRYVIEEFCSSYSTGITPNPCILCNKFIKFRFLLKKAEDLEADIVATGHYARVEKACVKGERIRGKRILLKKGVDLRKDQSYVLYVMTQEELSKAEFPLGGLRKEETKSIARELGLASALRPESQEICFVGEGSYVDFIKGFAPDLVQPGPVINGDGNVVGEHQGIAFYTIGQRKRLGIQSLSPHYVMGPMRVTVKIRSTMEEALAMIIPDINQMVTVEFDEPQWAPASGQSAVFYNRDTVVGGGVII
jgi:tRNA-specific 2-thiouridylase